MAAVLKSYATGTLLYDMATACEDSNPSALIP